MADLNYLFNAPKRDNYVMTEAEKEAIMPSTSGKLVMESVKGGYPLPSASKITPQGKIEVPLEDMSAEVPVKADVPVTPKIDELRNIFNPQTVSMETPVAKSDLIDMDKVRSQVPRAETGLSDWLTVLAPLATEAIFGGGKAGGVSYGIAGKHALDTAKENKTRANTLEDKLMEIEKARAIAGAKGDKGTRRFVSKPVWDKDLKRSVYANQDSFTGEYLLPSGKILNSDQIEVGFANTPDEWSRRHTEGIKGAKEKIDYTPRPDANTGLLSRVTPQGPSPIFPDAGELNPKQEKDLDNQIAKFLTTDVYKKNANALQSASTIDGLIRDAVSGNASSANVARSEIAKIAEGGGRLTDQDVERVGGPQDWRSKIARYTNLQKNKRPLLDSDIAELKQIADTISRVARIKLQDAMIGMETAIAQKGGVKGSVTKGMQGYIPKEPKQTFPKQVRKKGQIATVSNEKELKEASDLGWQ